MYHLLILLFSCLSFAASFNPDSYPNSVVMAPLDYTIYWRVDETANALYLALHVKTTGWIGFGIAEPTSGSMQGSDMMTGSVVKGVGSIVDRWASQRAEPAMDGCQDVTLISAEESNGYTTLEVKRPINSSDPEDRSIAFGPNRVVVSFSADGSDTFGYHGSNRMTSEITFFGVPLYSSIPVPGETTLEIRMSDFLVPNKDTQYACQAFAMPVDQDYTITQIDPVVNQSNIAHVHHFLAHVCYNHATDGQVPLIQQYPKPTPCSTPLGKVNLGCVGLLSAWAAGGGSTYTPPQAGFPMGAKSTSIKFIILEVHYNNPNSIGGLHYSTTPRQYEADVMTLGDPIVTLPPIPALTLATEYETECFSECTQQFTSAGSQLWTTQWRDGKIINEIGRIEYWAFDHQLVQAVRDRLNTHCVYNSMHSSVPITFGMSTEQEMCMHFISYYPRIYRNVQNQQLPYSFCGKAPGSTSVCGSAYDVARKPNPQHTDPPGGVSQLNSYSLLFSSSPYLPPPSSPLSPLPPPLPPSSPASFIKRKINKTFGGTTPTTCSDGSLPSEPNPPTHPPSNSAATATSYSLLLLLPAVCMFVCGFILSV